MDYERLREELKAVLTGILTQHVREVKPGDKTCQDIHSEVERTFSGVSTGPNEMSTAAHDLKIAIGKIIRNAVPEEISQGRIDLHVLAVRAINKTIGPTPSGSHKAGSGQPPAKKSRLRLPKAIRNRLKCFLASAADAGQ